MWHFQPKPQLPGCCCQDPSTVNPGYWEDGAVLRVALGTPSAVLRTETSSISITADPAVYQYSQCQPGRGGGEEEPSVGYPRHHHRKKEQGEEGCLVVLFSLLLIFLFFLALIPSVHLNYGPSVSRNLLVSSHLDAHKRITKGQDESGSPSGSRLGSAAAARFGHHRGSLIWLCHQQDGRAAASETLPQLRSRNQAHRGQEPSLEPKLGHWEGCNLLQMTSRRKREPCPHCQCLWSAGMVITAGATSPPLWGPGAALLTGWFSDLLR